jgi:uncharacterized protein (DUF924 family)
MLPLPEEILQFWFDELDPKQWWVKDPAIDARIAERFGALHVSACQAELFHWRSLPRGRLAEVIVLDQFSRNLHRDSALAFAADGMALALAQEAVARGDDSDLNADEKAFLYLPYMHSESARIHDEAVRLYSAPGLEYNLEFEHKHKLIIDRFGRYPHRNTVLGRTSTPEEVEFLKIAGFVVLKVQG